jgi:hypothetical protein
MDYMYLKIKAGQFHYKTSAVNAKNKVIMQAN